MLNNSGVSGSSTKQCHLFPRAWGWGKWGVTAKGYGVSFGGDEMFKIDCGDSCTTLNKLKTIELYPLMVNCNYISKKERKKKNDP